LGHFCFVLLLISDLINFGNKQKNDRYENEKVR
jgi:hypothetical protein